MDILQLIGIVAVIVAIIAYKLYKLGIIGNAKARKIGTQGEDEIAAVLKTIPNSALYRNLYIMRKSGRSTEIDLVLLTYHKIYVIESKNYNGSVLGKSGDTHWVVRYRNGSTFSFYSPELQNQGHIKALRNLLGLDDKYFESVIVFGKNTNISNISGVQNCITVNDLYSFIAKAESTGSNMIPNNYINTLRQTLQSLTNASISMKTNHIRQVQRYSRR